MIMITYWSFRSCDEWLASIKFGVLEVELDVIELLDSKLEIFSVKDSTSCFRMLISSL